MIKILLIFLLMHANEESSARKNEKHPKDETQLISCKDELTNGTFKWKYRQHNYAASEPLCWDVGENNPIFRKCNTSNGEWEPKEVQCHKKYYTNTVCPEDLIEISEGDKIILCAKISNDRKNYNEEDCYGSDSTIINLSNNEHFYLSEYLKKIKIEKFWLPLRRANNHKVTQFAVRLPGKQWGDAVNVNITTEDVFTDKNCLTLRYKEKNENNSHEIPFAIETTDCANSFYTVCIFRKHILAASGCPQGFAALSYKPNECYGINWESAKFPDDQIQLSLQEYYEKRNTLQLIFEKIEPKNEFFEVGTFNDESNSKYVVLMNKHEKVKIQKVDNNKFNALCTELVVNRNKVKLILKMDNNFSELRLVVYNRHYIWSVGDEDKDFGIKCFTNADDSEWSKVKIKKIWENSEQTKSIFQLKLIGNGPGEYWCEAHTIFQFKSVVTQRVIATKKRRGHPFSMSINTPHNQISHHISNFENFGRRLRSMLDYCKHKNMRNILTDLEIENVRVMSIEKLSDQSIQSIVHVMVSNKNSAVDNSEQHSSEEDDSEETFQGIRHDTSIRIKLKAALAELVSKCLDVEEVRSTEFCFPETFKDRNGEQNQWLLAQRGQMSTTLKLCLKKNGMPYTRKCTGNFIEGAYWDQPAGVVDCSSKQNVDNVTKKLYKLNESKLSKKSAYKAFKQISDMLEDNKNKLSPADLYYMAKILKNAKIFNADMTLANQFQTISPVANSSIAEKAAREIVRIYNHLMNVNRETMRSATQLNSTNILLDAFETLIDKVFSTGYVEIQDEEVLEDLDAVDYTDIGVSLKETENLLVFTIDPSVANISGVAIFNDGAIDADLAGFLNGSFYGEYYRFLQTNVTIDDLLFEPNLQMATYVPDNVLNRLNETSSLNKENTNPIIVIKVYANDKLFQDNSFNHSVADRVISISIPGYNSDLPDILPLALRVNNSDDFVDDNITDSNCSYWNYKNWASDGLIYLGRSHVDSNVILCGCTHLTPFAYLIGGSLDYLSESEDEVKVKKIHHKALDIISLVGCSLSLFGIIGTFVTAAIFQTWRQKPSSKVLLQLSAAITLQMTLFCFVNTENYSMHLIKNDIISSCVALGALVHYSVLVQFCWMLIIAHLQFKRYVNIFNNSRPKRFIIKSSLFAWGMPLLPVLLVAFIGKDSFTETSICYPSGNALIYGVILPITIIILANLITFILVIYNILKGPDGRIRHTEKRMVISQIRLSILLFFLLGFTWIFGLMSIMKLSIVFSYMFSLTATLQGFVIFVYFIILDPKTRRMWLNYFRSIFGSRRTLYESSSMKETTQTF